MSILKNDMNQAIEAAQTKNYFLEAQDLVQLASFTVDQDFYVIDIMRIKQIIEPTDITVVRNTPDYLKGVIELRNTIIPIIDLRERLGLKYKEQDRYTKYLIVIVHSKVLGIIVDSVNEIITIPKEYIKPAPRILLHNTNRFYLGMCNFGGKMRILLNLKKIVSDSDFSRLNIEGMV